MRNFLNANKDPLMLRSAQRAHLEAYTTDVANFLTDSCAEATTGSLLAVRITGDGLIAVRLRSA